MKRGPALGSLHPRAGRFGHQRSQGTNEASQDVHSKESFAMVSATSPRSKQKPRPGREVFTTSRAMEYLEEKELVKQVGHDTPLWRLALIKELVDNSLDACEAHGAALPII